MAASACFRSSLLSSSGLLNATLSIRFTVILADDTTSASEASRQRRPFSRIPHMGCLTFIGSSLGPIVVGWASDRLAPQFGALSLRYALCLMGITILWSAWHFWCASRALGADLERAH